MKATRAPAWALAATVFALVMTSFVLQYEASVLNAVPTPTSTTVHLLFSTSCDQANRRLLSSTFQHSATVVGQVGPMTEIISGCAPHQMQTIATEPALYYNYHRHFAPDFSPHPVPNVTDDYTPYNKPFGLRHFFEHATPPVGIAGNMPFALFDADFVLFAPIVVNTGRDLSAHYIGHRRDSDPISDLVVDGVAIAHDWATYMEAGWFREKLRETKDELCAGRPCASIDEAEGFEFYGRPGPPYIMTKHDGMKMIDDYCEFVLRGRAMFPTQWMVEMYAYGLAAGNNGIKHTMVNHLGINWPGGEPSAAWDFVPTTLRNPCTPEVGVVMPPAPPTGLHYCQRYGLSKEQDEGYYFYKYALPKDLLDCNAMTLALPPPTQWEDINRTYVNDGEMRRIKRHEVWAACSLAKITNAAIQRVKTLTCPQGYNSLRGVPMNENPPRLSAWPNKEKP
ncbi:hypothetical protein ACHHYP_09642 [Achlya hypogyna]|uniref:Secreted protein n=1 Tax=Achlya hypogyna TaxID=1202772 RepID=A0A1V9YMR6_ACHHY|nr:hypothetical protein ACHHYP_09642 [Achlya hypogyna]